MDLPVWIRVLDEEEFVFLHRFLLLSGSLKDLARQYGISYPTVRLRLDRLIAKVTAAHSEKDGDPLTLYVSALLAEGTISKSTAKRLLAEHRKSIREKTSDA